ncbi:hypothetical protein pv_42 [Pithovirus sibericum]|uniref:Uncharacterized protein n=1 Tax=Pithovirus sibericum TaxID=1450746 RepID=W5S4K3_9VIRU|nr:hypothetical protein pv_42 [Pithovirus sibericum]AHH01609.1 hypothetical protein pv_42 [Pithovirus sibericum]WIL05173.1 hypothetical protein pmam_134 [Pithovirus mammoth]
MQKGSQPTTTERILGMLEENIRQNKLILREINSVKADIAEIKEKLEKRRQPINFDDLKQSAVISGRVPQQRKTLAAIPAPDDSEGSVYDDEREWYS